MAQRTKLRKRMKVAIGTDFILKIENSWKMIFFHVITDNSYNTGHSVGGSIQCHTDFIHILKHNFQWFWKNKVLCNSMIRILMVLSF